MLVSWGWCRPVGHFSGNSRTDPGHYDVDVISTIGHEIGHVLMGYGHPDDEDAPGPAPLVGTDRTVRLMCGHSTRSLEDGRLLVKSEWEAVEDWQSENIDTPQP